jgi:predicted nucleic acid-binding protein
MKRLRIYLDNCCFNRPYDDQAYEVIKLEAEAKLFVQDHIKDGKIELAWSFMLEFENAANPYEERKESISEWKKFSIEDTEPGEEVRSIAKRLESSNGIKPKDALHLACAIEAKCQYVLTTDRFLLKKALELKEIIVITPVEFIIKWEEK